MTNTVFERLLRGTLANSLGKVWQLLIQLATVPIMSHYWGVEGFGIWLMISTIPNYLAFSELGVGAAGAVEMTRLESLEKKTEAVATFNTTWFFLTAITLLVGLLVSLGTWAWYGLSVDDGRSAFSHTEIAIAIALTICSTLMYVQMNIRRIVFQATNKYALGIFVQDILFLISSFCVLASVAMGAGLIEASLVQFVTRAVALLLFSRLQQRYEPSYRVHFASFEKDRFLKLLRPSMGAFSLTLANSFGLQGVVLTIGWAISPTAAAIFATTRMLTRIPMQFSNLLTRASLPELTRAQVSGNATLTQKLMKINFGLTLAVMLPAALILSWLGPEILHYMSNGEMSQTHLNFALLGLAASLCAIWTTLGTRLISVNRQSEFSYLALALYALSALMPFAVGKAMTPILVALVVADGLIAFKTWRIK